MRIQPARDVLRDESLSQKLSRQISAVTFAQLLNSALLAAPVIALVVVGYQQRWISEDAYISLRVAEQVLAGNGPVFNLGERVEAHTNPLWVAILALPGMLGADVVLSAMFLGIVLSALGLLGASYACVLLEKRDAADADDKRRSLLLPVGALAFVAVPVVADFVTSGLESGLGFGWLGFSFWILAASLNRRAPENDWRWYAGAVVLGLGPLIRPDFAIFSAGFLLALLGAPFLRAESRPRLGSAALFVLAAGALPVGYQILRMGYYAMVAPNTAITKEAGLANWEQGRIYFNDFVDPYRLWIPVGLVLALCGLSLLTLARKRRWGDMVVILAPILTAAAHTLYVVRVGGDFMHARLLLPAFFALLLPVAVVRLPLTPRPRVVLSTLASLLLLVWAGFAAFSFEEPHGDEVDEETGIANERVFYSAEAEHPNPVTLEDYATNGFLWVEQGRTARERAQNGERATVIRENEYPIAEHVPDGVRLVVPDGNIGIMGYAAGTSVHVVDRLGLADPIGSRMEIEERDRPGHEKALPMVWVAARFTGVPAEQVNDPAFADARAALQCGQLAELTEAVTAPMTMGRFLENISRSWEFYEMRVPPDPAEARSRFCGEE